MDIIDSTSTILTIEEIRFQSNKSMRYIKLIQVSNIRFSYDLRGHFAYTLLHTQ